MTPITSKVNKIYAQAGVDYSAMDPIKVLAQQKARATASHLKAFGMQEIAASRGESAYVWEEPDAYRTLVIEGLGTKNLVADATRPLTGKTHYDQIAQDAVAMIVNDLIVVGALPQVINAYFAVGESSWLSDQERSADLVNGWAAACELSGATWGGGETPTLKGVIHPETIDIGGSAVGMIAPKERLVLGDKLAPGDAIVVIASSGIHANGISLARKIAGDLPKSYGTKMPDGRLYGEALLTPTIIYVPLVRELLEREIPIHYMVNVTGHGWRKLMRATQPFTYTVNDIGEAQAEFSFIQGASGLSDEDMYSTFNMGIGFAVYVPRVAAADVVACAKRCNMKAWVAGKVEKGPKRVVIKPKNITYEGDSLEVR
jgi:phosphoribosylformylglycinamidine cyclo-ligase